MRRFRRPSELPVVGLIGLSLGFAYAVGMGSGNADPVSLAWILGVVFGLPFVLVAGFGLRRWHRQVADLPVVPVQPIETFSARHRRGLLRLRLRDPDFDEAAFLARAREAWLTVQRAQAHQDLDPTRVLVSDGVFERNALKRRAEREGGRRTELERVEVEELSLVEAVSDRHFDALGVFVRTRQRGAPVALPGHKPLPYEPFDRSRNECLTFLRVRDPDRQPGNADRCPNCSAAIRVASAAYCPSCQGVLRRGAHDWVLAEVADRIDWIPTRERELPGVARFLAHDPSWSRQHLEDRVAVIFWRLALAEHEGSAEPLRRVADESFCAEWERAADAAEPDGTWAERSIGEVATLALLPGEDWDRVLVEVRWLAVRESPDVERPGRVLRERRPLRHLLVLGRRPGARTRLDFALSSAHCPGCGAPEGEGERAGCRFCGAVPSEDWVLLDRLARHDPAAEAWLRAAREAAPGPTDPAELALEDPDTAAVIAAWVVASTPANAKSAEARSAVLARLAELAELPLEVLEKLGDTPEARPADSAETAHWLHALADLVLESDLPASQQEAFLVAVARRGAGIGFYPARRVLRQRARRRAGSGT